MRNVNNHNMKTLLTILTIGILTSLSVEGKSFYIDITVRSCSDYRLYYSQKVFLIKDSLVIDSVETIKYNKTLAFLGFSGWTRNTNFRFKDLQPGNYSLKYECLFDVDTVIPVKISNQNEKVVICFDILPDSKYRDATILDLLNSNDTLFIDCYIAALGEFGGYDQGLWITKSDSKLFGQFYNLEYTYCLGIDLAKIYNFYKTNENKAKPIGDKFEITPEIKIYINNFLNEVKNYRTGEGYSNALEHFIIYNKTEKILKWKHNYRYQPYLKLKEKITVANKRS